MASKGPRSKLDHESRAKRQKALEAPREPQRPKTHWDHVLEEMVWLSKDFESERKWKLAQAKKVALRASKGMLDQATRGERKMKEEENRLRKVALNISKDVKKFWVKIEKLVLYKHQMELDEKKKKTLDKQLEFLLGQTERYSTMLAENLVDTCKPALQHISQNQSSIQSKMASGIDVEEITGINVEPKLDVVDDDEEFHIQAEDESEDDEQTIDKDEAHITAEERQEELAALHKEIDLPLEELLKQYARNKDSDSEESSSAQDGDDDEEFHTQGNSEMEDDEHTIEEDEALITAEERQEELAALCSERDLPLEELLKQYARDKDSDTGESSSAQDESDGEFHMQADDESEDDEHTIEEDEALITAEERQEELSALQNEIDLPLEDLLKRCVGTKDPDSEGSSSDQDEDSTYALENGDHENKYGHINNSTLDTSNFNMDPCHGCDDVSGGLSTSEAQASNVGNSQIKNLEKVSGNFRNENFPFDFSDEQEDGDFMLATAEEKDDETTLSEEEKLETADSINPIDEIALLQKESEMSVEELLAKYRKDDDGFDDDSDYSSALSEDLPDSFQHEDVKYGDPGDAVAEDIKKKVQCDATVEVCTPAPLPEVLHDDTEECLQPFTNNSEGRETENIIEDAAAAARSAQPTGNTFSTTNVRTKLPFILKHPLREYQHIGLDWLVTMYEKRLNGILADEMGLGKTIMTISLLAHLACEKGIWGPHLIVVPTSVMLNWETEFLKWCPAFKILTYFGSAKERKLKRQGWLKPNSFHVCITTYRLVIQDSKVFKRKKWKYLILDEAHLIKNWKSQRWQTLLNFNSKRRILLTGTPLQNDLMELWSLMHFLMPHIFQSHQEFKDWFCNPISGMVDGQEKVNKEVVDRLHNVLRPFILRRLKQDVEKQLPMKHEHVIYCRLSKRQRNLYEDFIASSETQATLASANFFGMISIIMQLRKVCNHPDLFEGRPIVSSFDMSGIDSQLSSSVCSILEPTPFSSVDLRSLGFLFTHHDFYMTSWESDEVKAIETPSSLIVERAVVNASEMIKPPLKNQGKVSGTSIFEEIQKAILEERLRQTKERVLAVAWWNSLKCNRRPVYSTTLRELVTVRNNVYDIHLMKSNPLSYMYSSNLAEIVLSPVERFQRMIDVVESFMFAIPAARAAPPKCWCSKSGTSVFLHPTYKQELSEVLSPLLSPIRPAIVRRQLYFPDRRLIQFDCGKLQELAVLLRKLKSEGHRALIFTQMTKMLDVLEAFINLYGYTYMRLDGSTQPEERQTLMQRFNTNTKIFLFILSTRSGGVGINLVGADTVIFYDSDWNPAMDQQAQDRCHRIGQTREVHIYRLISESTIEENILKKAHQKRVLDDLVIQSGGYNTEFFKKLDPVELFSGHRTLEMKTTPKEKVLNDGIEVAVSNDDVEAALKHAEDEADYMALKKVELEEAVENQEFTEEAIGRLEDDDYVNDDDIKTDEPAEHGGAVTALRKEDVLMQNVGDPLDEKALSVSRKDDHIDLLADVKEMAAAAAAAGQEISSFENQFRPIDRYAIRFLELWDPIIDKAAMDAEVRIEETEWELDRIEKYKEEMEAEIDEDEEPLVYECWDADFATEAYRQQVEALAQHQLMEELESEAREKEDADAEILDPKRADTRSDPKPKPKKKTKKGKFKPLKKGSLASESKPVKEEPEWDAMSIDDDFSMDVASPNETMQKKRKKEDGSKLKKSKKFKKVLPVACSSDFESNSAGMLHEESVESKLREGAVDFDQKPSSRGKMGGKIFISPMPIKRTLMIKPERAKKTSIWSRDCFPPPDIWWPQEDAILCAMIFEYGPNWSFISETLYSMTAGGSYRGRYRQPVHCSERYRELIQKYVLCAPENANHDKSNNMSSGKALLKVTEENIRLMLDVAAEQPNRELVLQKHFTALLSSIWKLASLDARQRLSSLCNGIDRRFLPSPTQLSQNSLKMPEQLKFTDLTKSRKLIAAALENSVTKQEEERVTLSQKSEETPIVANQLELTLEFQRDETDSLFPSLLNLSINEVDLPKVMSHEEGDRRLKHCVYAAEDRYRAAVMSSGEDCLEWASSAFPRNDPRSRVAPKTQTLGKHKLSISDSIRPTKSKSKKMVGCRTDIDNQLAEFHLQFMSLLPTKDSDPSSYVSTSMMEDIWTSNLPFALNSEESEIDSRVLFLDEFSSNFTAELDEFSSLSDYTDIDWLVT